MARFDSSDKTKRTGATYTPVELARFVAGRLLAHLPPGPLRALDPSVGEGALLDALSHALGDRLCTYTGYDTDEDALQAAAQRLPGLVLKYGDFLERLPENAFDLAIANPPYVRTQVLGAARAQALSKQFGLDGKVDLAGAFVVAMLRALKPGGIGAWIVTNRLLMTQSGAALREHLREHATLLEIWDLGDTELFDAAVLPAVLIVRKGQGDVSTPFVSAYTTEAAHDRTSDDPLDALNQTGRHLLNDGRTVEVRQGHLAPTENPRDVWRLTNPDVETWLQTVDGRTWKTLGEVGVPRVGIKTTADKVFIRDDWEDAYASALPEVLRPLTTHHVAGRYHSTEDVKRKQVLYPHAHNGEKRYAVALADMPHAADYLEAHRERLEGRSYVQQSSRPWYVIWVPHDPRAWDRPKLVWRDISVRGTFWMDPAGTVVNGDCYWLAVDEKISDDLLWLAAAVGNSDVALTFYDLRCGNRLYRGRRRWITQYVRDLPIPDPVLPASRRAIAAAKAGNHTLANQAILEAFDLAT